MKTNGYFQQFLSNHVLSNLFFALIIILGTLSYINLPRQQDPTINFNWIQVTTILPGASAADIEQKITNLLEEGLETLDDINFLSSNSREGISSILIRFNDIDNRTFDKRISDIQRIVQQKTGELPEEATEPNIFEVTSSNAFPSATIVLKSRTNGEVLRYQAKRIKQELERMKEVDQVNTNGLTQPEIRISYYPEKLANYGINVSQLASTIKSALKDVVAGDLSSKDNSWLVRVTGVDKTPEEIAKIPINTARAEIPLSALAKVESVRSKPKTLVRYQNQPAIMLTVMKKSNENTLKLIEKLRTYTETENLNLKKFDVSIHMTDDQTEVTKSAISVMENNFLIGLLMVLFVTWLFLGAKIAFFITISIPFTIAGTFIILSNFGFTLNTSVLLGIVIVLGMLVDDAVVVVESIYFKMRHGVDKMTAIIKGIQEVIAPVTTSVLTTTAAFLPLMLLPGILGKFMLVLPLSVTIALAISLIEAYWILPSHIMAFSPNLKKTNKIQRFRNLFMKKMQVYYSKIVIRFIRHPLLVLTGLLVIFIGIIAIPANGLIKFDFFASDKLRLFYINVYMPSGTPLEQTMKKTQEIELVIKENLPKGEYRSVVSYSGILFTEIAPLIGKRYGQVQISLKPRNIITKEGRNPIAVDTIVESLKPYTKNIKNTEKITYLTLSGGPPTGKPISMKMLGDDFESIQKAVDAMQAFMKSQQGVLNISDDTAPGNSSFDLKLNYANLRELNISPEYVIQTVTSLVDGLFLTTVNNENQNLDVRLLANKNKKNQVNEDVLDQLMRTQIVTPDGSLVSLNTLVTANVYLTRDIIKHYNFKRAITIEADINTKLTDTDAINKALQAHWNTIKRNHPKINIDFSGQFDDIQESMSAMLSLFIMGIGLIYLILGTQFKKYLQPLFVLTAVPIAFIGTILGLFITGYSLSLYTLYGIIALSGISVNASIVMIAAANQNMVKGIPKTRAMLYAARRRLIPITITTLTTVAGLLSLAIGLGGESLIWGPVASTIVFGLVVSSTLTVFCLPVIFIMNIKSFLKRITRVINRFKPKNI